MRHVLKLTVLIFLMVCLVQMAAALVVGSDNAGNKITLPANGEIFTSSAVSFVDVSGINAGEFPEITAFVNVNTTKGNGGNLTKSNFKVTEDSVLQTIKKFSFASSGSSKADILFVFDDTGSMDPTINGMKNNVLNLTDNISAAGIDARYSLVSFGDTWEIQTDCPITSNVTDFKNAVDALYASGGGDEAECDLDAIMTALNQTLRSDAQRVVVVITDTRTHYKEDGSIGYSSYNASMVQQALIENGITFIVVSPDYPSGDHNANMRLISEDVGGKWINFYGGGFSSILNYITKLLTTTYKVTYDTTKDIADGTTRHVVVTVTDPDKGIASGDGTYIAPFAPVVDWVIVLKPGWNFISTPKVLDTGADTALIFSDVDTSGHSIWSYNANTKSWDAMTANDRVRVLDGIWIYSATDNAVNLTFNKDPLATPPTKLVYKGWNAIGFSDITATSAKETLLSVGDSWSQAIGFDATAQVYEVSIIRGATGLHSETKYMRPTKGYWLYQSDDNELAAIGA